MILLALIPALIFGGIAAADDQAAVGVGQARTLVAEVEALLSQERARPAANVTWTVTAGAPTTSAPTSAPSVSRRTRPPPVSRFPTRAQALARPNVVVVTGARSTKYRIGAPPPDTTYDLRALDSTAYPSDSSFPISLGRDTAGARTVVVGGTVVGTQARDLSWEQVHDAFGGAGLTLRGVGYQASYDFRADNQNDGIEMLPRGADAKYLIAGAYMTWIRDDAVEADNEMSGTISDVLVDGVNNAISLGQSTRNAAAVTRIRDAIFIHAPMRNDRAADGIGHQTLFKQAPAGRVNLANVTDCMYENPISPGRIRIRPAGTWTNVTFVLGPGWVGADPSVPAGATVSRDWQGKCVNAAAAWKAQHGS